MAVNATILVGYVDTSWFAGVFFTLLALSVAAIILNILVTICNLLLVAQHVNSRILFANLTISSIVLALCEVLRVINAYSSSAEGQRGEWINECSLRTFQVACSRTINWSFHTLALERAVATVRHATYGSSSCTILVSVILVPVAWVQALAQIVVFFGTPGAVESSSLLCPLTVSIMPASMIANAIFDIVVTAAAIGAFGATLRLARKKQADFMFKQAQFSLESRLQLRQSLELTEMLIPSVIAHAAVWLLLDVLVIVVAMAQLGLEVEVEVIMVALISDTLLIVYVVCNPIVAFYKGEPLRRKCAQLFRHNHLVATKLNCRTVDVQATMSHFGTLNDIWASQYDRRKTH